MTFRFGRAGAALLLAFALAGCGSSTPVGPGGQTFPAFAEPLSHKGQWLVDAQGRVVIFHGTNVAMKLRPYTPQAQGFTQQDAAMLAREGFSVVRVWVFWNAIEPAPGQWDDSSLVALRQFIGWLHEYGISTILNFGQTVWGERFGGLGFPDWAANTNGLAPINMGSVGQDILLEPPLQLAWDNFYANQAFPGTVGLEDELAQAWTHVAQFFRDTPGIVGYDLVNEPEAGTQTITCLTPLGCPLYDSLNLTPFYERIVAAVRKVDDKHMLMYEPEVISAGGLTNSHVSAGTDPNLAVTFHFYPQTDSGISGAASQQISKFTQLASSNGDGLLFTEFGATDDLTQLSAVVEAADQANQGWLYWAWYSTEPTGDPARPTTEVSTPQEGFIVDPALPPDESNLKADKLTVLDRPYPYFTAGTPQSWSFDTTTRTFSFSYSTSPVGGAASATGPTVVVLPARTYPGGYQATVSGAQITSAPGSRILTLEAHPGIQTVELTVSPQGS